MKKIIYTSLLIIWMLFIFFFSSQNSIRSEKTSDQVTSNVIDTVATVTNHTVSGEKKKIVVADMRLWIRKSAHFGLFFVLGILTFITFKSYQVPKTWLAAIIFCLLYACSDEIHQLFSGGRTARVLDVFIDTFGASVSIFLLQLFDKYSTDKMKKRNWRILYE